MELKAPQQTLLDAPQFGRRHRGTRHTQPILANALMRKSGGQMELITGDLGDPDPYPHPGRAGRRQRTVPDHVAARKLIDSRGRH